MGRIRKRHSVAFLKAVPEQMPQLKRFAAGIEPHRRPSNAKGFEEGREEFEEEIKKVYLHGMETGDPHLILLVKNWRLRQKP